MNFRGGVSVCREFMPQVRAEADARGETVEIERLIAPHLKGHVAENVSL